MKHRRTYQTISLLGLLAGLALFFYLIEKTGLRAILASVRLMGASFLLLLILSGARHYLRTLAWHHAIEREQRQIRLRELFAIRLAGEAITDLTFAGPFLGETVKAFAVSRRLPVAHSLSSLFIENLLYSVSVALFILSGLLLLLANFTMPEQLRTAIWVAGAVVALVVLAAYVLVTHRWLPLGLLLDYVKRRNIRWARLESREEKIRLFEQNVYGFYNEHRGLFFYIFFLELLTNFTGVIEAWIILRVITGEASLLAAFIIESVNRVVNVVFAFVPLRLGVEEGGAALTLRALGYSVGEGVSLAIIRKIRSFFWIAVGLAVFGRYSLGATQDVAERPGARARVRKPKRLIVNADDFGLTEKVNEAIIAGHRRGIITSASLLANGAAFPSAVEMARQTPTLGIGIHLNLTDGRPVTAVATIPSLVSTRGLFAFGPVTLVGKIKTGKVRLAEVERELRAQIEKVLSAGLRPTHLDGHKHIHALPALWRVVLRLAREYAIVAVRVAREASVTLLPLLWRNRAASSTILKQYMVARALALFASGYQRQLAEAGLGCADYFYGITQTGFLDPASLEEILLTLREGTSELMCHPGYFDAELEASGTRLLRQREREFEALAQPGIRSLAADLGIELISYRNLAEGS